jgi:hypothetical protein
MYASGGWSHGFLVEKNHYLWPDIETDRLRCQEFQEGREALWKELTVADIEDAGQQELMSWICVAGAMHEMGHKGEVVEYLETTRVFKGIFTSETSDVNMANRASTDVRFALDVRRRLTVHQRHS